MFDESGTKNHDPVVLPIPRHIHHCLQNPLRLTTRMLFGLLVGLLFVGCGGATFGAKQAVLPRAPDFRVAIHPSAPTPKDNAVHRTQLEGIVLSIQNDAPAPYTTRVVLKSTAGNATNILFRMPKAVNIPVRSGERLIIHFAEQWDSKANSFRRATVLRDGKRELRFVLQSNDLLPQHLLPLQLKVLPGTDVVYTETARVKDLCFATTEHRTLRVDLQDAPVALKPGHNLQMTLDDGTFVFWAIDNRQTQDSTCEAYRDDAFSWLLVRLPEN